MTGKGLPDENHIVRYVKPSLVGGETVNGGAFLLKRDENGLSVNWLELFGGADHRRQVDEVRRLSRLGLSKNGRYARLNVGETKQHVSQGAKEAGLGVTPDITSAPLAATTEFEADPSHAEITGLPPDGTDAAAMLVGDLIADCVQYPLYAGKIG